MLNITISFLLCLLDSSVARPVMQFKGASYPSLLMDSPSPWWWQQELHDQTCPVSQVHQHPALPRTWCSQTHPTKLGDEVTLKILGKLVPPLNLTIFWDTMTCTLVEGYTHQRCMLPSWSGQMYTWDTGSRFLQNLTSLHSVTFQKTAISRATTGT